jgi:nitrate/nitrite-specific signal transduction histidine kinase
MTMTTIKESMTETNWTQHLEHLYRIAMIVTAAHDVDEALQTIVDSACELTDAELGALGVPGAPGEPMTHFVVSGLPATSYVPVEHPPIGRGVLSFLLHGGNSVRLDDVKKHPYFEGWPKAHPVLGSFIGTPIQINGHVLGDLYLANKQSGESFTEDDQRLVEMLAAHAAVVLQTLLYHEQSQDLAISRERETIGRELEDDVLQGMYGVGLLLNNLDMNNVERAERDLAAIRETFDDAIERLRAHLLGLAQHK